MRRKKRKEKGCTPRIICRAFFKLKEVFGLHNQLQKYALWKRNASYVVSELSNSAQKGAKMDPNIFFGLFYIFVINS